jgi:hypothetical protein
MVTSPTTPQRQASPTAAINPRANTILTVAGIALTLIVLAALAGVVVIKRGIFDDQAAPVEAVVLAPANAKISDPFTASVAQPPVPISEAAVQQIQGIVGQLSEAKDRGVRLVSGARPGLYAGSGQGLSCNAAALANELVGRPQRGAAWARTLAVPPQEIPAYLNSLTPVTLTVDTWVTSHRYTSTAPAAFQTVLQAGTAVLIDPAGVPRVHCATGDPLLPPANRDLASMPPTGQAWPGYDIRNVVAIAYSDAPTSFTDPVPTAPLREFTLIDLGSGEPLTRKAGDTIELGAPTAITALPDPISTNIAPP